MDNCLAENNLDKFNRLFKRYWELVSYRNPECKDDVVDYDLIFANILVDGDDWTLIDYEWTMQDEIEDKEVAFRAVYCYLLAEEKRNQINLDFIMEQLNVSEEEAQEYRKKEQFFQKKVTGKHKSMGEIRASLGTYAVDAQKLMEEHLQEILDKRIQLYYDRGQGFHEEDSQYMPDVYVQEQLVETEIPIDGNVLHFRLDPADRPCIVKLKELLLNGVPVPFEKKALETNGKQVKPGCYVFATADPNIVFHMTELTKSSENVLAVKMEVSPVSMETATEITSMIKRLF